MSDKISVRDFKLLIEGMDMAHGEDWAPTNEQWKRIRDKIRMLDEQPATVVVPVEARNAAEPVIITRVVAPNVTPEAIDANEAALLRRFPAVPTSLPPSVPIGQQASAFGQPSAFGPPPQAVRQAPVAPQQVKTPDIDSTRGYNSSFV